MMRFPAKFVFLCVLLCVFVLLFYFGNETSKHDFGTYKKLIYSSLASSLHQKVIEEDAEELVTDNDADPQTKDPLGHVLKLNTDQNSSAKETIRIIKDEENYVTPSGFVEVLKGVLTLPTPKPRHIMRRVKQNSSDFVIHDTRTPIMLNKRAKMFANDSKMCEFLTEQSRRRKHIGKLCAERRPHIPTQEETLASLIAYPNMIFDRVDHLTFCPVYKAASTSWSVNLLQLRGIVRLKERGVKNIQTLLKAVFPSLTTIVGPSLTKHTTKFMIVRHPFDRLVSCYRDKYENAAKSYYYRMYGERMVQQYRDLPNIFTPQEGRNMLRSVRKAITSQSYSHLKALKGNPYVTPVGPTFNEFIQFVTDFPRDDEHWRPYYTHCASCFVSYDYVLRFENLYDESNQFIEYLNRTADLEVRWDNKAREGVSTEEIICEYLKQLSVASMQRLQNKYANDFLLYEYSADEYVKCAHDYKPGDVVKINAPKLQYPKYKLAEAFR